LPFITAAADKKISPNFGFNILHHWRWGRIDFSVVSTGAVIDSFTEAEKQF
jgi:hypothetical protein